LSGSLDGCLIPDSLGVKKVGIFSQEFLDRVEIPVGEADEVVDLFLGKGHGRFL
jgi:hypothetical protein